MGKREFVVTVVEEGAVAAAASGEEKRKRLRLSNLDWLLPPLDVGVFFCYKNSPSSVTTDASAKGSSFHSKVSSLKEAMARALSIYRRFGGEGVVNPSGEPEILCSDRGVDFVVAYADVELRDLDLHDLEGVEHKLMPKKKVGLICGIQVTELKCGGVVVACLFDHRVADAYSFNMFLISWAEAAASKPITTVPSYDLSPVTTFLNRHHGTTFDIPYVPISSLPPPCPDATSETDRPISRIYRVAADYICRIQAPSPHRTKIECFGAHLWQAIARNSDWGTEAVSLGIVVDGRKKIAPSLMSSYFGNVLSVPYATRSLEEMKRMQPEEAAEIVHEAIRSASGEHFQRVVEWAERIRPTPVIGRVFAVRGEAVVLSSGRWFPLHEVDLGWGRPALWSYHFPWEGRCGYVMPMSSGEENGDWLLYVRMRRALLERLEREEGALFQRERILCPVIP